MHTGVVQRQAPRAEVSEILKDVLREERCEGSHHGGHEVEDRTESLHGLQTLSHTQITLHSVRKEEEGGEDKQKRTVTLTFN